MATKKRSSSKKSSGRKYGKAAGKAVKSAMHRKKKGTLSSGKGGKGGKVKSRKQAIAIGLSEARKKGAKVPKKKKAACEHARGPSRPQRPKRRSHSASPFYVIKSPFTPTLSPCPQFVWLRSCCDSVRHAPATP